MVIRFVQISSCKTYDQELDEELVSLFGLDAEGLVYWYSFDKKAWFALGSHLGEESEQE